MSKLAGALVKSRVRVRDVGGIKSFGKELGGEEEKMVINRKLLGLRMQMVNRRLYMTASD